MTFRFVGFTLRRQPAVGGVRDLHAAGTSHRPCRVGVVVDARWYLPPSCPAPTDTESPCANGGSFGTVGANRAERCAGAAGEPLRIGHRSVKRTNDRCLPVASPIGGDRPTSALQALIGGFLVLSDCCAQSSTSRLPVPSWPVRALTRRSSTTAPRPVEVRPAMPVEARHPSAEVSRGLLAREFLERLRAPATLPVCGSADRGDREASV
jgi:hypothetical protein